MIPKTASMVMITQPRLAPFVKLDEREPGRSGEHIAATCNPDSSLSIGQGWLIF
jgi:hypothetical protein